mgnify:CR=1 FL=1
MTDQNPAPMSVREERRAALRSFPHHIRALVSVPRRTGELALIAGMVLVLMSQFGWNDIAGWSPIFLGSVAIVAGGLLVGISMAVRARLLGHHARVHGG